MAKIIDTHSHILPGIDDGAGSWKEALCMLKTAQAQGIRRVIATPHWGGPFGYTDPVQIRELCFTLQEKARRHNISVKIYQGQEVMYTEEAADRIANGEILTLADSRYVLAEFYQGIGYSGIFRAVQRFTQSGYSPIIAHAERYEALKDIGRLEELRKQGAYIQLNFRAIGGKWHDFTTRWCRKALKEGFVHFVGTDMHNMRTRKPETESAVADYKTNLNYKSSGWFFLCNLYKNGKTRKRCKRMNDSAFLNSRRTGIFKDMSNGTICIPKDLRDNNGLEKNDRVELIPMQEGIYIRKAYGEKKCQ